MSGAQEKMNGGGADEEETLVASTVTGPPAADAVDGEEPPPPAPEVEPPREAPPMAPDPDYRIILWKKGDTYYGLVEEMGLLQEGSDPASVVAALEKRQWRLHERWRQAGLEPPPPKGRPDWRGSWVPWGFLIKSLVVVFILLFGGQLLGRVLVDSGRQVVREVNEEFGLRKPVRSLANALSDMAPEQRRETLTEMRRVVIGLEPFLDELRPLWHGRGAVAGEGAVDSSGGFSAASGDAVPPGREPQRREGEQWDAPQDGAPRTGEHSAP